MTKNVLIVASNHGLWAEELQGPWDALEQAGNKLTLATYLGKKPTPSSRPAAFLSVTGWTSISRSEAVLNA
jgi:putative intracellular protease/amidase